MKKIIIGALALWAIFYFFGGKRNVPQVITVIGEAKSQLKNQKATFSAGVEAVNDKKEVAVKEVNDKMEALMKAVKEFGIKEEDVKTQNISVYQNEETYYEGGVQKVRKGQWRVNNGIDITLRSIDQASKLSELLTNSGANNVWGPNFSIDDSSDLEKTMYQQAIDDAKERAKAISLASKRKLGKILSVSEVGDNGIMPMYKDAGMGGSPIEAGSTQIYKSVTVTFELK
ncbi:MAG TPA: SIMPL domain-containing protein [Candidatus Woesebacteria bacterium]|nr:SIMPL domain-containing protein [Candidatus Woesebacteria bacterium]